MGVLTVGDPLSWEESLEFLAHVRDHGVIQFVKQYEKYKSIQKDELFYGDEIEYGLFRLEGGKAYLSLRGAEVRELLERREVEERRGVAEAGKCTWHPEYGAWMVESTPAEPYSGFTADLRRVETNMRARRARLLAALKENEIAPTIVVFPMLGVSESSGGKNGTSFRLEGPYAQSRLVPDEVINPHPRFGTLTRNIRSRRGDKVKIEVPLFKDAKTRDDDDKIEMDAMAFGMGCCCLQVTLQCRDVEESRHVYDQCVVLAPIMLALTAATPILNGKLSDHDVRWEVIEMSVDDRTPAERGSGSTTPDARLAGSGTRRIQTSRYAGVSSYLCNHKARCDLHCAARHYNDVDVEVDERAKALLAAAGCDELLSRHIAHLFVRDPLVLFQGMTTELDDDEHTDHFENIQSTNWNSVRWKPPPAPNPANIGWRVELRTMEVQLTDFENAAFTVFITLVLRVLLSFDLNVYMPMSKVHENMRRAHERDAATKPNKFWWRSHLAYPKHITDCVAAQRGEDCAVHSSYERLEEMSILEILAGKKGYYPGLVPLVLAYLDQIGCDPETERIVRSYCDLIVKRASGELLTAAAWMRRFVREHPDYGRDSIVPPSVAHDLLRACHDVGVGKIYVPELLGVEPIAPVVKENAYNVQLARVHLESKDDTLSGILERYAERARLVQRRSQILLLLAAKNTEIRDLQTELAAINSELEPTSHNHSHNGSPAPSATPFRSAPQLESLSASGFSVKASSSASDLLGLEPGAGARAVSRTASNNSTVNSA
ncbi:hypothetical protein CTAYLR_008091 [Chrysophaeum taylorii]|uniref:Glutamate--cysteine ligase n=1 Tax=Chrysophaeum taylorii TaxID=2483200 RepID=A0AAD7UKR5_9STRA|nr:hypothetical protein CTAYLR_008091 [Chrysophaeum taylorii]